MVIAFWSNVHGQCGNSTNAGILAMELSNGVNRKGVMFQIGYDMNRPELLFGSNADTGRSNTDMEPGLEVLLMGIRAGRCDKRFISNCCMEIGDSGLSILKGPVNNSFDYTNRTFIEYMNEMIDKLETVFDVVFIDIGIVNDDWYNSSGIGMLINRADIEVVSLNQNIHNIERFLQNHKFAADSKRFFVLGQYIDNLKWNYHNLKRKYKFLTSKNSGVIPYDKRIRDSVCGKGLAEFLTLCREEDDLQENCFIDNIEDIIDEINIMMDKRSKTN